MEGDKKLLRDESNPNDALDQPEPKRIKQTHAPILFSVIRLAVVDDITKRLCSSIKPIIQETVQEEMKKFRIGLTPPLVHGDSKLKFVIVNQVPELIYTGNRITDGSKNLIQIQLINTETGAICENGEGSSAKAQVVVIDGDLEAEGCDSNTFNTHIVRPRDGKPALLSGNTVITLKNGVGFLEGISFTDNSSCIRSGKFRLGVFVDSGSSTANRIKIKEGLSEKFSVKDHRGELNKKHYPPSLQDETWRLESIARDGKYHMRLKQNGIHNVQDLLRKWMADSDDELRKTILQMPNNVWNKLIDHARTCSMGVDSYLFRSEGNVIRLNPVGVILEAFIDGTNYHYNKYMPPPNDFVLWLAFQAYKQWDKLEKYQSICP